MGKYDAPTQVDFVRSKTGNQKVAWIGHSQGTTQMFYAIANNEAFWKERLSIFVALAPVTKLDNCGTQLLTWLAPIWKAV
jgi:pimeloyl-ACP methyl ester carboxylesterase